MLRARHKRSRTGIGLGLPALAGVGGAVAIIRTPVVLWVIRLPQRTASRRESTE
jgi:hypothetical protein